MGLKINEMFYWTDSHTVIRWIRSDSRRYVQFVAVRIGEILESSEITEWRWLPTKLNVADEATKWTDKPNLNSNSRWYLGPAFLKCDEELLPEENFADPVGTEECELKSKYVTAVSEHMEISIPDIRRIPKWTKFLRSTAYMLRFVNLAKGVKVQGELTVSELVAAETHIWRRVQWDSFPEDVTQLKTNRIVSKKSRIQKLSPCLTNDGLIRIRSRLEFATAVPSSVRNQIILDPKHVVQSLVQHHHDRSHHQGREAVANLIRQMYWILNLRAAVKSVWSSCQVCKNRRTTPIVPIMGNLPPARVDPGFRPFVKTGVDYFGTLEVTVGRSHVKRWGLLFTCLNVRAVHLEIAHSLTTDSCIMALQNFFRRRGRPRKIWSDNGSNLTAATKELRTALGNLNQDQITKTCALEGITWNFIPPAAPHMGGAWERMVRSVKTALKTNLKDRYPRDEVLHNLFIQAEFTINCHPLTFVSLDHEDDEALTPNHFLLGSATGASTPAHFNDRDIFNSLRCQWRYAQRLADHFWRRWIHEYLPTLTRRIKWHQPAEPLAVGDVVIVVDPTLTRNTFPKGVVTEVFPERDGQVRAVSVRTTDGVYKRPTSKIAKLDVRRKFGDTDPSESVHGEEDVAAG